MPELQERIDRYLNERLTGYIGYYDRTAQRMKKRHLQTKGTAAVGAVLIPVVSNLPWQLEFGGVTVDVSSGGASIIGLAVALILALEGVFHFKEQWQNYRGTEQFLLSQRFRFENRTDEYESLESEDAFRLFVKRVEDAILEENNVTLNILGRAEPAKSPAPPKIP